MKKLINDPRALVREMLEGVVLSTGGLALLDSENVVIRADIATDPAARPVALLSGGGSGHEPAHAGYVGPGMLSAAIVGDVFTSPSTDAVLAAIRAVAGPAGALLIVKNYTGDRPMKTPRKRGFSFSAPTYPRPPAPRYPRLVGRLRRCCHRLACACWRTRQGCGQREATQ